MKKGFSLIELLVVITIIAILMSVGLVSFRQAGINARNGKRKTDMETLRQALVLYRADNAAYPTGVVDVNDLVTNFLRPDYLSADAMVDPKNKAPFYYTYVESADGKTFTLYFCLEPSDDPCSAGQLQTLTNP